MAMILLVLIYLRVSTEEQARKGHSLPEQREACWAKAKEIARQHEATTGQSVDLQVQEFVDDYGGDIIERPVLEKVREIVRNQKVSHLVCLDPDRFSRSLKWQLIVADEIEAAGTRLVFVQQEYNPDDMMSKAFFQFRGLMSEIDKAKILERTSRGKRGKMKAGGRPNGACPYGYRHIPESDQLEIYEPEARWVRAMFEWVAEEHLTPSAVAQRLNDLGVPTKRGVGKWYRAVARQILYNSAYTGQMRCNRADAQGLMSIRRLPRERRRPLSPVIRPREQWIMVPVPPIIEQDLWDAAHRSLSQNSRRGKRTATGLLSLLIRCGVCGRVMSYNRKRGGRHGKHDYIFCRARYLNDYRVGTISCSNVYHRIVPIEDGVWRRLVEWLTNPSLIEEYLATGMSLDMTDQADRLQGRRTALAEQLADKQREQVLIIQNQARRLIAEDLAEKMLADLQGQVQKLEAAIAGVDTELLRFQPRVAAIQNTIQGFRDAASAIAAERHQIEGRLSALNQAQRRELILKLVRTVTVYADGTWRIDPN